MLLGSEISERKFHTLYSLSFTVGIRRPRLARLLKKLGLIPEDATEIDAGNMTFEAEKTVPLIEAFKSAILLHDVPTYLGASKGQVETLYRIGAILPLVPRTERGSVRNVVFGKKHLDEILTRISDLPVLEDLSSDTLHQLSYASQRGAGRFELLFQNILDGKSPGFRHLEKDRNFVHLCRCQRLDRQQIICLIIPKKLFVLSSLRRAFLLGFYLRSRNLCPIFAGSLLPFRF